MRVFQGKIRKPLEILFVICTFVIPTSILSWEPKKIGRIVLDKVTDKKIYIFIIVSGDCATYIVTFLGHFHK